MYLNFMYPDVVSRMSTNPTTDQPDYTPWSLTYATAFDMSTTTIPSRSGRGSVALGIDTQCQSAQAATAMTFAGWLTPPQSAHESRRGSLAQSAMSDAPYFAVPARDSFSQPVTPMNSFGQTGDVFVQQCTKQSHGHQLCASYTTPREDLVEGLAAHHSLSHHSCGSLGKQDLASMYASSLEMRHDISGSLRMSLDEQGPRTEWYDHQQLSGPVMDDQILQSSLFRSNDQHIATAMSSSSHYLNASVEHGFLDPTAATVSFPQHPQFVVPSQVSPSDDCMQELYSGLSTPEYSDDRLASRFGSSSASFSTWKCATPPAQSDVYLTQSSEEDFVATHTSSITSPTPWNPQQGGLSADLHDSLPLQPRKRSARKAKSIQPRMSIPAWNFDLELEGNWKVGLDKAGEMSYVVKPSEMSANRHQCKHAGPDGEECRAAFARMEHLRRHEVKHKSGKRPFPCNLPGCRHAPIGISRPDNAGDHFKTHLKCTPAGRRNHHFEWPDVKDCIVNTRFEKPGTGLKLIANLERWIRKEPKAESQRKHLE